MHSSMVVSMKLSIWNNHQDSSIFTKDSCVVGFSVPSMVWSRHLAPSTIGSRNFLKNVIFAMHKPIHLCSYIHCTTSDTIYVLIYVDDFIITGNNIVTICKFISKVCHQFKCRDLGTLVYSGVRNHDNTQWHDYHITQVCNWLRFGFTYSKLVDTPTDLNGHLSKSFDTPLTYQQQYRSLVEALQYLTIMHSNISFAFN